MKRILVCAVAFAIPTWLTLPAAAQDVAERFHLGLGTPLVSYTNANYELDTNLPGGLSEVDVDVSSTRWGIAENPVALELGYGLSELIVLGGFLQLGGVSESTEIDELDTDDEESQFQVAIGPKIDFMFLEGGVARPFATLQLGLVHATSDSDTLDSRATGFQIGGGGGVRLFPAQGISIDPALALSWATVSGEWDEEILGEIDVSGSGINVAVTLALSAWIR